MHAYCECYKFIMRLNQSIEESLISQPQVASSRNAKEKYIESMELINGEKWYSKPFFSWISPLLSYGKRVTVTQGDLPHLPPNMKPKLEYQRLDQTFKNQQKQKRQGMTLTIAIAKAFWKEFALISCLAFFVTLFTMTAPILTKQIILYIHAGQERDTSIGLSLFFLALASTGLRLFFQSHMYYNFQILGYHLCNALSLQIYSKSLRYPVLSSRTFQVSDIINYSQVDAERMTYMGQQLATLIFTPAMIIAGLVLMYSIIGPSFLAGIGVIAIVTPCTFFLSKKSIKYNDMVLKAKDARMKVTQEMLNSIKFIKSTAIEKHYFQKINAKRNIELALYRKKGLMETGLIVLYWMASPLILSMTFVTYIWLGNQITAEVAFTTIMIFSILKYPLNTFPTAFSEIVQMYSSIKRIEKYLLAPELKFNQFLKQRDAQTEYAVQIKEGQFFWGKKNQQHSDEKQKQKSNKKGKNNRTKSVQSPRKQLNKNEEDDKLSESSSSSVNFVYLDEELEEGKEREKYVRALNGIDINFRRGRLTMILGEIGSGKSSLLLAILNEMRIGGNSRITINDSIAYAAQKPWIMSSSVQENIVFTLPFDQQKFNDAVHYAAMEKDLEILPKGVQTQIGEKGVTLSGGQKARISLARALYSEQEIVLLDDILSAVDVHVAQFLMRETILKYLSKRTVIMTTHALRYAELADDIVILKKGVIVRSGSYEEVRESDEFAEICLKEEENKSEPKKGNQQEKVVAELQQIKCAQETIGSKKEQEIDRVVEELMLPEDQQRGQINSKVFKEYVKINGGAAFVIVVAGSMSLWITFTTFSNIWMERWCEAPKEGNLDLYIYLSLAITSNIFIFIRVYTLVVSSVYQGGFIHKKMIKALLYTSLNDFYNRVPMGRIVNRLTKDLRELDQAILYAIGGLLVTFFSLLGTLTICLYASTPLILIPIVFVGFACYKLQRYYMMTQRELSRLRKSTNSPIVSGFLSMINGVATIRAYELQQLFFADQVEKIDLNKRALISREALQSWFGLRLSCLSFIINMSAIGFSMLSSNDNPSLAGLLMTYALNLSDDVISLTWCWASFEIKMVSLERIYNFIKIEPEKGYLKYVQKWRTKEEGYNNIISEGQIEFKNMSACYRPYLPFVLKDVTLLIRPGTKVGVVGRTGAGKTTLVNSILRLIQPAEGVILIDGVDIQSFFIKDLRNAITMIDQDPTLMQSNFRQNLDVTKNYTDDELWKILAECGLDEIVRSKDGLEGEVSNESLSAGQKQLLCICRAFLKRSRIVLIDQATASVDVRNDYLIQEVIKKKFATSTVITIAHRLTTLNHCDMILVMEEGRVLEWGTPQQLQAQRGAYAKMVQQKEDQWLR